MRSIHNQIYLNKGFVFLYFSVNTFLIIAGYLYQFNLLLLGLLIALPLLTLAMITWRKNSTNSTGKHVSILYRSDNKLKKEDNLHLRIAYNDTVKKTALIGNDQCIKPYVAKMLSISMKAEKENKEIYWINAGNNCLYNSENFLSTRMLSNGDLIWQIKSGYAGCGTNSGQFCAEVFKNNASRQDIKMIEVDLTRSEKGLSMQIASLEPGQSRNEFIQGRKTYFGLSGFYDADGLVDFLTSLRNLSAGKVIGLRISISDKKEFYRICHAFRKTHFSPDFITVKGFEESDNYISGKIAHAPCLPLYESIQFVSQTLKLYALDKQIKIIASTERVSPFEILKLRAFGSDVVSLELPGYFADLPDNSVSMVQSRSLNNHLLVLHDRMMWSTTQLMDMCGLDNIDNISLSSLLRVVDIDNGQQFGLKAASY